MEKILVLYAFHIYNDRVKKFIDDCIFYDENVDFLIICNNPSINFTAPPYVKIMFRENTGFDFGAWSEGLLKDNLYKNYDKFIFANSSIIGPFLPENYTGKWTDIYINGLKDNIKLFGSTINSHTFNRHMDSPHVQSYIFSVDKITLQYLIDCKIFRTTDLPTSHMDAILQQEVLMSTKILEKGWNIGCLLPLYKGIDFTFSEKKPEECGITFLGDIAFGHHRGKLWNDNELVFIKGNRM